MVADSRRFWGYVTRNGSEDGFHCRHCGSNFESGGPRKIKYHLAKRRGSGIRACTGKVPEEIRRDCLKVVLRMEANTKPKLKALANASILDKVVKVMKSMLARHAFVPSMASILFSVRGIPMLKERIKVSVVPEAVWRKVSKFNSKYFKDILVAYQHMKELLEMKDNLDVKLLPSFSCNANDVTGSLEYREMVKFVLQNDDFWISGNQFVQLIEPLLRVLAVLTVSGTTIGHVCRCLQTAKAEYELRFSPSDEVFVHLNELWEAALTPLSKAAAVLDPAYLYSPGFDRLDASKRLLEFKQEYVLETDKDKFQNDVDAYLGKSSVLFSGSAMIVKDEDHPVYFWHYLGRPLPTLRRYAEKLVFMKSIPSAMELEALFANERELDRNKMSAAALHVYEQCDAERLTAILLRMRTSGVRY